MSKSVLYKNIVLKDRNLGHIPSYLKRFISINRSIWEKADIKHESKSLVVEGLTGEMPTHLIRLGVSSISINNSLGLSTLVILKSRDKRAEHDCFGSFGIAEFEYLDEVKVDLVNYIFICLRSLIFRKIEDANQLLNLKYKGIPIGELIYDEIIMSDASRYTINKIEHHDRLQIKKAMILIEKYRKIIRKNRAQAVLTAHNAYIDYGTLGMAAIIEGKRVYTVSDMEVSYFDNAQEWFFMQRHKRDIIQVLENIGIDKLATEGSLYLKERERAEKGPLYDAKNAFKNKRIYTRDELKDIYTHNNKKNVFIYMHVFSDSPHVSDMKIHKDYYDWFVDTIEQAKKISCVNWFVKVHPSAFVYSEYFDMKDYSDSESGIFLLPEDFSTSSTWETCDVIITCQGTIGIEASCKGIPVIASGKPFYDLYDIVKCPRNIKEYHNMLNDCHSYTKLDDTKIKLAQAIMGAHHRAIYYDETILDEIVYEYGGYGKTRDYQKSYEQIINNIKGKAYDEIPLYNKITMLVGGNV